MNSMGITGQASGLPPVARRRLRWRGREDAAGGWWARPALLALLAVTAAAYAWNLSASGYANSFYAAAVQAGTESWKAFFFGSLDSSSFITVDKPPAAFWVMALSGRIFGFSSWSMLAPQALEGVAAVALLYAAIKRWFGAGAGLAAGAMLAMTPVAALMFRFNNPDALLVMLLVASAYTLTRAIEGASTRWIVATGALIGFAFLAKMGQAFLVLPGFGLAYLVAAPATLRRRLAQLSAGFGALIIACGWWVAIVALLPASSRPYIDGSPDNNIFNLIFGYNGFSRIFGSGGPGGGGGANFSGSTGVLRLFNDLMGGQASWLLPASLAALVIGLALRWRAPRTDRSRAALILWGGWLLVTAAIFSFSTGVIHTYYSVALAPAIAALVAIAGVLLWEHRANLWARLVAAVAVTGTGVWSYALLDRTPSWEPWLRTLVIVAAVLAAAGILGAPLLLARSRQVGIATAIAVAVASFGGPLAYAGETITTTHGGSLPSAGPTVAGASSGGFGDGGFIGARGAFTGAPGGGPGGGSSGSALPSGPPSAAGPGGVGSRFESSGSATTHSAGFARGGAGDVSISRELAALFEKDADHYRWVAATSGSSDAAAIELATDGKPVMAIGGFNGNGGELTLAQFKTYVARGDIHYYVDLGGGGGFGAGGRLGSAGAVRGGGFGASSASAIASWVAAHYKSETVGGVTLYVL
jgi:4-amino-4-deoxy-L-arabinose transferase-like glycosyltransferase